MQNSKPAPVNVRPPSLALDIVWRPNAHTTLDYPASPNASMRNFNSTSRPCSYIEWDSSSLGATGPRPSFFRDETAPSAAAAAVIKGKAASASVHTTRTTATFMGKHRDSFDVPELPITAEQFPHSSAIPQPRKSRFRKALRTAGVVLRISKKHEERGIGNIVSAPVVPAISRDPTPGSSKGSVFRSIRSRKFSKAVPAPMPPVDTFAPRAIRRSQSFAAFVDANIDEDEGFDEITRETMGLVVDIGRGIDYAQVNTNQYTGHIAYAL